MVDFVYLDSGVGGLPYLKSLKVSYPKANVVYVADTKNFPYGQKSYDEVVDCACACVKKVISKFQPKIIVVACNTISVAALDMLRKSFPAVSFVGTVPAIKKAAQITKTHKIALLATNHTIDDNYTQMLISEFAKDCVVVSRGDPILVDFIENQYINASEDARRQAIKPAVDFFVSKGCDTMVLACTHFLNMTHYFCEYGASKGISVIDSIEGVTNQALRLLAQSKEQNNDTDEQPLLFVTESNANTLNKKVANYQYFCEKYGIRFAGILQ